MIYWVLTWISDKWLSLSSHTAYSKNEAIYWIPSWLLYRKILTNSSDIKQAKIILENNQRTIANNLMIWDYRENTWIVAEFDPKKVEYRTFDKQELKNRVLGSNRDFNKPLTPEEEKIIENKKILVTTNHFKTPKMKKLSTNKEWSRYEKYFQFIEEFKKLDMNKFKVILRNYRNTKAWESISNNWTVQSVIMLPELRKIFIANGKEIPVSKGEYVEIEF